MSDTTIFTNGKFSVDYIEGTVLDLDGSTVFLMDKETQKEDNLYLDWGLPLRPGHEIKIFRMWKSDKNGQFLAVKNKNLDKSWYNPLGVRKVIRSYYGGMLVLGIILLFFYFSGLLVLAYRAFACHSLETQIKRRLDIELS